MFWADGFWAADFWKEAFWDGFTSSGNAGTPITNSNATTSVPVNYVICDRTGFRLIPDNLVKDGYGGMVRKSSVDPVHPQDRVRGVTERQKGSVSPEGDDTFISTAITPDDL